MPTNLFNVFLNSNDSIGLVSFTVNGDLDTTAIIKNIVTSRIAVGMRVTGLYIPNNTKVVSIDSATQITISNNTTGGINNGVTLVFRNSQSSDTCRFNVGSILSQAPNAQELENRSECLVKVKYFAIERTASEFTTDLTSTIQVRIVNQYPNNIESRPESTGYNNMISSNIVGVFSTGNTDYQYSDLQTNPNDYVCVGNIFNGTLNINITDQDGDSFGSSLLDKDWNMFLCVYFPPTQKNNMNNMPIL
jgi:hypothetical protein